MRAAVAPDLAQRRRLLVAALASTRVHVADPLRALTTLRDWLDSWTGLGAVVTGMTAQGFVSGHPIVSHRGRGS